MRRGWSGLLMAVCVLCTGAAWAEIDGGIGMEYFTVQAYTRDLNGIHLLTLVQGTLPRGVVSFRSNGWFGECSGGSSDWRSSGEWKGTEPGFNLKDDDYFATAQQHVSVEAGYEHRWGQVGVAHTDQSVQNYFYNTEGNHNRLNYRLWADEVFARVALFQDESLRLLLGGGYAPGAKVELYHNGYTSIQDAYNLYYVESTAQAARWHGTLRMDYHDPRHWNISIVYDVGWAQFSNPQNLSELSLRTGSLAGYFILWF